MADRYELLTEDSVLSIMRDEWKKRTLQLESALTSKVKTPEGRTKPVLGTGTKVAHKGSKLRYDVIDVSLAGDGEEQNIRAVTLRTPEGVEFEVPAQTIDAEYEVA